MNFILTFKRAKVLVAFLLTFTAFSLAAQNVTLTGKVVNQKQEGLPGATVYFNNLKKGVATDFDGNYTIKVPEGKHSVTVSFLGYTTIKKDITTNQKNIVVVLTANENILEEVLVSAVRVKENAPVSHSNLTKKQITKRNLGQDIPVLMNYLPSVVTTSDAGAGVGYTGIRVRGSDATRVNVTINGIPYNDSESQGTYWVNMQDFASSTQSIQLQRGVGTSTNGAGAFGASLNVLTDNNSNDAFGEIASSFGSFNTQKYTVKFGTGKLNEKISFTGRLSKISSDGYIDRASSDLKSYFLQGSYTDNNTLIKALVFGGHEITYQSWNGNDQETIKTDRTFNSAGAIYNTDWTVREYYDNEVDNYKQDHYQLHWNQKYSEELSSNIALHYTYGRGFYEQYKQAFTDNYDVIAIDDQDANNTDQITRKWLDNHFYGLTYNFNYNDTSWDIVLGGAWNNYEGDHFGEVIWARYAADGELRDRFYDDYGHKTDVNLYSKATYNLNDKVSLYGDLQYRIVSYKANGVQETFVNDTFNFFNPKAGINYELNKKNNLYFSYAKANREPNRTDYENGNPKPEQLDDFELGWRFKTSKVKVSTNLYYMFYTDQLALTGEIDDVGSPIRANIGESYRLGLEIDAHIDFNKYISIVPNVTLSQNKNIDFQETDGTTFTSLGDTDISYSPNIILGNSIVIRPIDNLNVTILSKFVGEQFMSNNELDESLLDNYLVNDVNINYSLYPKSVFKEIVFSGLINNVLNEEYSSNGYMWGTTAYYYPQAGTNFLLGATLKF